MRKSQRYMRKDRRGVSLIVTVSVMMILSMMAVTFSRMASNDREASLNFSHTIDARLTAFAGVERAVAIMQEQLVNEGRIRWTEKLNASSATIKTQLLYPSITAADANSDLQHPDGTAHSGTDDDLIEASRQRQIVSLYAGDIHGNFSFSGTVENGRYLDDGNFYALKIKDTSGGFNLNSHVAADNSVQTQSNAIFRNIIIRLATECTFTSTEATNIANVIRLPTAGASTPLIVWNTLDEFTTALANNGSTSALNSGKLERFLSNLTTTSRLNTNTLGVNNPTRNERVPPQYYSETRCGVNVNAATTELLTALISNIKATAIFYVNSAPTTSDTSLGTPFQSETSLTNVATPFVINFTLTGTGSADAGEELAKEIVKEVAGGAFEDFGDLERFLDDLATGTNRTRFFPPLISPVNADAWFQACADAVKSNFNPNATENFFNPNAPYYRRACKGDLRASGAPSHTTELSFSSIGGNIEISSVGRIMGRDAQDLVATAGVSVTINLGTEVTHTTQADFEGTSQTNTITMPVNMLLTNSTADPHTGAVEPRPTVNGVGTNRIKQYSERFASEFVQSGTRFTHNPPVTKSVVSGVLAAGNVRQRHNLAHDGLLSKTLFGPPYDYFVDTAFDDEITTSNIETERSSPSTTSSSVLRNSNTVTGTNISNSKGTLEFWLKLDTDQKDVSTNSNGVGVPAGLIGVTITSNFLGGKAHPDFNVDTRFREGVQMYLYRNSLGFLRFSRLYWAFCFDNGNVGYGALFQSDVDPDRKLSRRDISFNTSSWNAHEWHHIMLRWDDTVKGGNSLDLIIDGTEQGTYEEIDSPSLEREWCVLNEKEPLDAFYINGFERTQRQAGGFFLFGSTIDYPGNGTIDQMASYSTDSGGLTSRNRYTSGAQYTNALTVPEDGRLTNIRWTSYPSYRTSNSHSSGSNRQPHVRAFSVARKRGTNNTTIVSSGASNGAIVTGPDGQKRELMIANTDVQTGDEVEYRFLFNSVEQFNASGRHVCASLDSVTMTIMYTYPRTLSMKFF